MSGEIYMFGSCLWITRLALSKIRTNEGNYLEQELLERLFGYLCLKLWMLACLAGRTPVCWQVFQGMEQ